MLKKYAFGRLGKLYSSWLNYRVGLNPFFGIRTLNKTLNPTTLNPKKAFWGLGFRDLGFWLGFLGFKGGGMVGWGEVNLAIQEGRIAKKKSWTLGVPTTN